MSHLEDLKVILRLFYQVFDGKIHPLSVPETHTNTRRYNTAAHVVVVCAVHVVVCVAVVCAVNVVVVCSVVVCAVNVVVVWVAVVVVCAVNVVVVCVVLVVCGTCSSMCSSCDLTLKKGREGNTDFSSSTFHWPPGDKHTM